jgi:hypothetical protein
MTYGSNIEQTRTNKDSYPSREKKSLINAVIPIVAVKLHNFTHQRHVFKTKGNYYGYSIEANSELSGILDLTKMKWIIEPQKAFKTLKSIAPLMLL